MLRLRSNCSVMSVPPCVLVELMLVRPAIAANCFSSGSATDEAIVSGLAPGSDACTRMVGKVHARQIGDRQLLVGEDAEHQDAQHQQRRRDRPPDEDRREIHGAAFDRPARRLASVACAFHADAAAGHEPQMTVGHHRLARLDAAGDHRLGAARALPTVTGRISTV